MRGQARPAVYETSTGPIGIANSRLARWSLYALMAFPIVDYSLRFGPVHVLGVVWDKVVLVMLLLLAARQYITGYRLPNWRWTRFAGWYVLLLLGVALAGFVNAPVSVAGFKMDVYYILMALLVPFVVRREDVPKLLHAGAMTAILIGVHGVYQFITKAPIPGTWVDVTETVRTRVYSVLQSPNELGAYMALMTPILCGLALYERDRWRKTLYTFGVLMCAATLAFTYTRGAWVALALAVLIVAVLFERRLFVVLVVLAAAACLLPPFQHRIGELLSPVYWLKASESGRIYRWLQGFDKLSIKPLFGVGLGRWGGAIASQTYHGMYSDNYYAKTMAESGLVGLTLFFAMHFALIRDVLRNGLQGARGRRRVVMLGGLTGLVAVLIHNGMENVFEFAPMEVAYFMYASLFLIWCLDTKTADAEPLPTEGGGGPS